MIYDTLIEKSTPEEIEAVLAHELGHWAHSDPVKLVLMSQLNLVLMLSLFTLFIHNASLYRAFGFVQRAAPGALVVEPYLPVMVGLELFQLVLNPTDALLRYPDFYKVAVSTSGNHDNRTYYSGWGERFHRLRRET